MFAETRFVVAAVALLIDLATTTVIAAATAGETTEIAAAVEGFHSALARDDRAAALGFLASDAVILESGHSQSRAEYEREHLAEDIAFVRATKTERAPLEIQQDGNAAWTTTTTKTTGTFNGRKIDSAGVELIVLTKSDSGWRIRAIHWSSRKLNN